MGYAGTADSWAALFPNDLVPKIIDLVLECWNTFHKPSADELEVPITRRFCVHLRGQKDRSRLPFNIVHESEELKEGSGELLGRIDLRLVHGFRDDVYFAIECKRLNVVSNGKRSSLAGDYVEKGMMRFITGKYAGGLDKGGMLGYVMDGNVSDAIDSVKGAINSRSTDLAMPSGTSLSACAIRADLDHVKQTSHQLSGKMFFIYHLFVGL